MAGWKAMGTDPGGLGIGAMDAALTGIFLARRESLIGTILRIVGDRQIAEDLTQEAYIRVRRVEDPATIENLDAFLHQTARNLARDHLRRQAVRGHFEAGRSTDLSRIAEAAPSNEEQITARQHLDLLAAALNGLPPRVQAVVILARLENRSNRAIAEQLGVSERTVFNDLKRAMGHCRDALARVGWP